MRPSLPVRFTLITLALLTARAGFAATTLVDSIDALQSALIAAVAGDKITLKDGVYTTSKAIVVTATGTAEQPITIAPETLLGVELAGAAGFNVTDSASYVVISGFKFSHASGKNTIGPDTSQVRYTRNVFECAGDGAYLTVQGNDAQIDYNEFREKKTPGSMLAVAGSGSQVARRLWIHHNYFHDLTASGANAAEMIRFGLSALSLSTGAGLVEHNLFIGCRGENDLISNRASGNTFRYNTLLDSPTAQLTLRHGNDCIVYGNTFRNTEGLRLFGDRHQIISNYFEGNYIGINLGNGSGEVADGAALTVHDRPDNTLIAFNTLVDNRTHYQLSRRANNSLGATKTTFANNLILGGEVAAKLEAPYVDGLWSANLLWGTARPGDLPAESFTLVDPLLVADAAGIRHLQAGSPAFETATGNYPSVVFDLDGQPRAEKKSIGADEISSAPASAHLLTVADVGPNAGETKAEPAPATATAAPLTPPVSPEPSPTPAPATAAPAATGETTPAPAAATPATTTEPAPSTAAVTAVPTEPTAPPATPAPATNKKTKKAKTKPSSNPAPSAP